MTPSSMLLLASAAVIGLLGTLHLVYTFHGPKLGPRDAGLRTQMESVSPVLTKQTTMWRAWVGFNASHSLGALLYALLFGWLAIAQPALAFGSRFLLVLGGAFLLAWLWLAWRFWFRIPLVGIALSLVLFAAAHALAG